MVQNEEDGRGHRKIRSRPDIIRAAMAMASAEKEWNRPANSSVKAVQDHYAYLYKRWKDARATNTVSGAAGGKHAKMADGYAIFEEYEGRDPKHAPRAVTASIEVSGTKTKTCETPSGVLGAQKQSRW